MVLGVCTYKKLLIYLIKHNHLQLQSRIPREWFSMETVLNTQHRNFTGRAILLDNTTSRMPEVWQYSPEKCKYICKRLV